VLPVNQVKVDPTSFGTHDLQPVVAHLARGGIVAFPTDTFYGLAVDPTSADAVAALFALKGRHADAAIPHVAGSREQVADWCGLSAASTRLANRFWPGPLSLVCDAPTGVVAAVHAGLGTVAIRIPDHPIARALALAWGRPMTATSANRSGEPPVRRATDLKLPLSPALLILDGGDTVGGVPSTIVDARGASPILVREGAVAWDRVLHSLEI
jgi:L-threonylcarbamoyladenylate synthase